MNPVEVNYQKDHPAIPTYQKESMEQVENKKEMFFYFAQTIAGEIPFETHLDVGCGSGYMVSGMRRMGKKSFGIEIGHMYHSGLFPEVKDFVIERDIFKMNALSDRYDLVSAIEVLEHLYAENFSRTDLNNGIINLIDRSNKFILITVPILTLDYCPWLDWNGRDPKIWPRILRTNEVPLNSDGTPILGHVTLATEAWWRCKLESFGLYRMKEAEDNINETLKRVDPGLLEWWHVFLYSK